MFPEQRYCTWINNLNFYHFQQFTVGKPELITIWSFSKQPRSHELTMGCLRFYFHIMSKGTNLPNNLRGSNFRVVEKSRFWPTSLHQQIFPISFYFWAVLTDDNKLHLMIISYPRVMCSTVFLYTETVKSVNKLISFIADSDKPLNSCAAYG